MRSVATQWEDPTLLDHGYAKQQSNFKVKEVQDQATQCSVVQNLIQDDSDSLLYTGLPLEPLNTLFSVLENSASRTARRRRLEVRDQILLTLMKLRLNLLNADLSRRFSISESTTSKIITYWVDKMEKVLRDLIVWLPRETVQATMPTAFKAKHPKTTIVLDCSENLPLLP